MPTYKYIPVPDTGDFGYQAALDEAEAESIVGTGNFDTSYGFVEQKNAGASPHSEDIARSFVAQELSNAGYDDDGHMLLKSTMTTNSGLSVSDTIPIICTPFDPQTVDIAFWWTENPEPSSNDILNAMSQLQTEDIISHTDNFSKNSLQTKSLTAKRDESTFKYAFFAWHKGFFDPEPTKVDTGFGGPSTWISTEVTADGEEYKVLTVEVTNNVTELADYGLIQEGIL